MPAIIYYFVNAGLMKIVVIGNGMVGYKLCEKLLAKKPSGLQLVVLAKRCYPPTIAYT